MADPATLNHIGEIVERCWEWGAASILLVGLFQEEGPARGIFHGSLPFAVRFQLLFMTLVWPIVIALAILYKLAAKIERRKINRVRKINMDNDSSHKNQ